MEIGRCRRSGMGAGAPVFRARRRRKKNSETVLSSGRLVDGEEQPLPGAELQLTLGSQGQKLRLNRADLLAGGQHPPSILINRSSRTCVASASARIHCPSFETVADKRKVSPTLRVSKYVGLGPTIGQLFEFLGRLFFPHLWGCE